MLRCPKCNAEVSESDRFCRACGIELARENSSHAAESRAETHVSYGPKLLPRQILSAGEHPLYETRPLLWPILISPLVLAILGIVIYVVAQLFEFGPVWAQSALVVVGWVGITMLVFGLLWILKRWAQWRYTIYAVTDRRILRQTGIIGKSYVDCSLGRVQSVYLDIPILGRIFGFGTIRVATAGTAMIEIEWKGIKQAREAQHVINEATEQYRAGQTEA